MRFLPLIALGGGAALLLASRNKKKGSPSEDIGELDDADVAAGDKPSSGGNYSAGVEGQQQILHDLGYGNIVGAIDGKMGANTKNGIKTFQRDYNDWSGRHAALQVDGKWGPNTGTAAEVALEAMSGSGAQSFQQISRGEVSGGGGGSSLSRTVPEPTMDHQITFSEAGDKYAVHAQFRYTTLQNYLVDAKGNRELLVKSDFNTWGSFFYDTFVKDPSTFIGQVTGGGDNVGAAIYAGLWIVATFGAGAAAAGALGGGAVAASGAATTTAIAIPAASSTALAATGPAIATVVIPAGGTATVGLSASGWAVAGTLTAGYFAAKQGLSYKIRQALSDMARGPKVAEAAYKSLKDNLGGRYPLWKQNPEMAASAMQTFFSFLESHYAYIGDKGLKVRLSDLPPSQTTVAVYDVILGNIYRFQASN